MKKFTAILAAMLLVSGAACACDPPPDIPSNQVEFPETPRRITFYDRDSKEWILVVEGRCLLGTAGDNTSVLSVKCKMPDGEYVTHFLTPAENITYFVEEITTSDYKVEHRSPR